MNCPYCNAWNIEGADTCESCGQELTVLEKPEVGSLMEASIMESHLSRLNPKHPVFATEETSVAQAINQLRDRGIGCLLIGSEERLSGVFSERDALIRIRDRYEEASDFPVSSFMATRVETLDIETPIAFALNRMAMGNIRHLPVTRKGIIAGIISLRDILRFMSDWYPDLIEAEV